MRRFKPTKEKDAQDERHVLELFRSEPFPKYGLFTLRQLQDRTTLGWWRFRKVLDQLQRDGMVKTSMMIGWSGTYYSLDRKGISALDEGV